MPGLLLHCVGIGCVIHRASAFSLLYLTYISIFSEHRQSSKNSSLSVNYLSIGCGLIERCQEMLEDAKRCWTVPFIGDQRSRKRRRRDVRDKTTPSLQLFKAFGCHLQRKVMQRHIPTGCNSRYKSEAVITGYPSLRAYFS